MTERLVRRSGATRRSTIAAAVAAGAFLFSSAPASAHHDMVCTGGPSPICVYGHQHAIDETVADPQGVLRDAILQLVPSMVGYVPDRVCVPIGRVVFRDPAADICVYGLQGLARWVSDQGTSVLEPAVCALWTAAGWRCD